MGRYFNGQFATKVILVACCLALIEKRSNALLLGNFIGCNSFGCRIAALEQDVGQIRQQVMRLSGGMNFQQPYNPNQQQQQMMNQQGGGGGLNQQQPFNQNGQQNQMNQQGVQPQQQQQQQGNNQATRQTYANMQGEYSPELRRTQAGYQNSLQNGQFMGA